jgi:hypothetical protein
MNANADIKPTTLEEMNSLIFDMGETIPEGDYLKLMNYTKDLFNEMTKLKEKARTPDITTTFKTNYIVKHEEKLFRLRKIVKNKTTTGIDILVFYHEDDNLSFTHYLQVGQYMRVYENGKDYKFIKIRKINDKSFQYDIIYIRANGEKHIRKERVFKFMDKTFYERLNTKNILYYSNNQSQSGQQGTTKILYDKLCLDSNGNRVDEENFVYNEDLKISDLN